MISIFPPEYFSLKEFRIFQFNQRQMKNKLARGNTIIKNIFFDKFSIISCLMFVLLLKMIVLVQIFRYNFSLLEILLD